MKYLIILKNVNDIYSKVQNNPFSSFSITVIQVNMYYPSKVMSIQIFIPIFLMPVLLILLNANILQNNVFLRFLMYF